MTNPAGNPMDAVAALMLERQRYEDWIAQLESRRSITPPHVFERVRGDYEARLREVMQQLSGRTAEVQATAAALTERLARMQSEETAIRDERYEAELRSHVGEVTAAQWSAIERESDERIAKLSAERTTITGEIARLQQLLSMTGGRTSGATAAPAPELTRTEKTSEKPRSASFDELEFLKSVTDGGRAGTSGAPTKAAPRTGTPATSAPVRTSAQVPRSGTPAAGSRGVADVGIAPIPGGNGTSPNAGLIPAPEPTFSGSESGSATNNGSEEPSKAEPAREPEPVPAFLRDVPQEQTKTLRCGECDAMNFPTEWYCERCGAELAGM
ncbi:MAG: hypothetical protein ACJ79K_02490 [Gemmatimonadaceae bacterium]